MAKETIFPTTPPRQIPTTPDGVDGPIPEVQWRHCPQVRWLRDCDVQLGIVSEDDPDAAREDGALFTDVLDRAQINRLIAVLRRARDSAYGADE